jgi:hypothetical protein
MSYLRVLEPPKNGKPARVAASDPGFAKEYPAISAYMTELFLPDGKTPRQVASLLIFSEDGSFKACLSDRHYGFNMWATAPTFVELLRELENRLVNDPNGWRRAKSPSGRRK